MARRAGQSRNRVRSWDESSPWLLSGALAKDGDWARLLAPLPTDPRAGTSITIRWTVEGRAPNGKTVPFGAEGMFVRLTGPRGETTVGWASRLGERHPPKGPPYHATVRVPAGGIVRLRFGLMGFSDAGNGEHPAPVYFPLRH